MNLARYIPAGCGGLRCPPAQEPASIHDILPSNSRTIGNKMIKHRLFNRIAAVFAGLVVASASHAGTFSDSLPEFSGTGANGVETVGMFTFSVPANETILSARIDGTFGNSEITSTSVHSVYADGILIASCADMASFCWSTGPEAWSYSFSGAELGIFADGQVVITTDQTDCCTVRLGAMTLTGVTAAVPEPGTYAMLLAGLGLLTAVKRRKA
ncbi:PEP-CTERM sorting domain-containing protein [Pseudoduganella lutea]|uniref:PEP-CTERM sorting domain-containing protein n=1 Tax=Pseudoduganella lutea TaxID=321985 RepID=UPI001E37472F|nr:PEP-CTERM sorting domain-containing protein [Pseudoduganella lutea]